MDTDEGYSFFIFLIILQKNIDVGCKILEISKSSISFILDIFQALETFHTCCLRVFSFATIVNTRKVKRESCLELSKKFYFVHWNFPCKFQEVFTVKSIKQSFRFKSKCYYVHSFLPNKLPACRVVIINVVNNVCMLVLP